jgi:hypothetical protein
MRALGLALVAVLSACGLRSVESGATALPARSASAPASVSAAPWEPAAAPTPVSAFAEAGTIEFDDQGKRWRYDGATGAVTEVRTRPAAVPDDAPAWDVASDGTVAYTDASYVLHIAGRTALPGSSVVGLHWSPDGELALELATPGEGPGPPGRWLPGTLVTFDPRTGAQTVVYRAPPLDPKLFEGKGPPPPWSHETYYFAGWSPDSRFVALWRVDLVSGSIDADGRELLVVDRLARSPRTATLGRTLLYREWLAWRAPHTLAFVAGASRFTTELKTLSLWSPESGVRPLTGEDESAIGPAWDTDGWLWFTAGPRGSYDPVAFFHGTGVGGRRLYRLDPATRVRVELPSAAGYVQHAALPSRDGRRYLELREPAVTWTADEIARRALDRCELWYVDGSQARPLVRLRAACGAFYTYVSLAAAAWDR